MKDEDVGKTTTTKYESKKERAMGENQACERLSSGRRALIEI